MSMSPLETWSPFPMLNCEPPLGLLVLLSIFLMTGKSMVLGPRETPKVSNMATELATDPEDNPVLKDPGPTRKFLVDGAG